MPGFGNCIPFKWVHFAAYFPQLITFMFPVTRSAVNALMVVFTFPSKLSNSTSTGVVSKVSVCPLRTFTVTLWGCPWSPSSAATSAFKYVFVEASSNNAFTLILRLPFFRNTGTVRSATNLGCALCDVTVVWDLSVACSTGSWGGVRDVSLLVSLCAGAWEPPDAPCSISRRSRVFICSLWSAGAESLCNNWLWVFLQLFIPQILDLTHVSPLWSPPKQR